MLQLRVVPCACTKAVLSGTKSNLNEGNCTLAKRADIKCLLSHYPGSTVHTSSSTSFDPNAVSGRSMGRSTCMGSKRTGHCRDDMLGTNYKVSSAGAYYEHISIKNNIQTGTTGTGTPI